MLKKNKLTKLFVEGLPLVLVLLGTAAAAFSVGPYGNWDQQLEFEASSNIQNMGVPYVEVFGAAIDQPPLGFYTESAVYQVFGSSTDTAVALVTLFGVASTLMMYVLGRQFYDPVVGLVAAAVFGLNPWHLVISRSALIDAQCLFLGLLCLSVGVYAIRRGSTKLALATGVIFAAAFMTKFYAAYILVPLLLFYVLSHPRPLKRAAAQIAAFAAPTVVSLFVWYHLVLGWSLLAMFHHNDFRDTIPQSTNVVASPFFATNFLFNYGVGGVFVLAVAVSLALGLWFRKKHPKMAGLDWVWAASVAIIVVVNVFLGYGLTLNVPYFSAFKYLYPALPFLVLIAASLIVKAGWAVKEAKTSVKIRKRAFYAVVAVSVVLVVASLVWNMYYASYFSGLDYSQFRVEPSVDYGYALLNPTPLAVGSGLGVWQFFGFGIVFYALAIVAAVKLNSAYRPSESI